MRPCVRMRSTVRMRTTIYVVRVVTMWRRDVNVIRGTVVMKLVSVVTVVWIIGIINMLVVVLVCVNRWLSIVRIFRIIRMLIAVTVAVPMVDKLSVFVPWVIQMSMPTVAISLGQRG
jgi:hypothetical protein